MVCDLSLLFIYLKHDKFKSEVYKFVNRYFKNIMVGNGRLCVQNSLCVKFKSYAMPCHPPCMCYMLVGSKNHIWSIYINLVVPPVSRFIGAFLSVFYCTSNTGF